MNPKTTFWLSVLALGMFAYIHFVDSPRSQSAERAQQPRKLLPNLDLLNLTSVEVTRSNRTVRAELVNDHWQIADPFYPAQATAIRVFLDALAALTHENEIPAQEIIAGSGGLAPFGLDPAWATIKVQSGTNLVQLRVGAKTLLGDRVYVQPLGATGIFMTDASLLQHLPASADQWRNPMLIHRANVPIDRIAITGPSRVKLERDSSSQQWRMTEPMATRADLAIVEDLIQQLRNARVSQFISDDPKQDLEAFGLQTPEAELTLLSGTNTVFQLQFGKSPANDPTQVYARRMAHTNVVLLPRALAESVARYYTEFRDRVLLSFVPERVNRIEAQVDEFFALQRQSTQSWRIVEPFQAPADRQLMQLFLEDLARLEIIRFEKDVVTDFAPYGLAKPTRQYVLKTTLTNAAGLTNQPLMQVDFGNPPPYELDKVFCRRSDENSVYVVAFADMARLERAAYGLRDRHLWDFAAEDVTTVTVLQRGLKREFLRDPVTRAWDKENPVINAGMEETLHRLGQLQADSWSSRGEHEAKLRGVADTKHQVILDLKENGQSRQLVVTFGNLSPTGQPFAAVTLEQNQPVVFKFPAPLYALLVQYFRLPQGTVEL